MEATTILAAEDDPGDAFILERALAEAAPNALVQFVRSGKDVLDYLEATGRFADREKHPMPAVLILDLKLPRLDGCEVIAWVRRQKELASLRIVVLTGSGETRELERASAAGADCCFLKPTTSEDLPALVRSLHTVLCALLSVSLLAN